MLLGGLVLIAIRYDSLRAVNGFDSLVSRGVRFPREQRPLPRGDDHRPVGNDLSRGGRGHHRDQALGRPPPSSTPVFVPIGLALILLTGIGPLISWRRMSKGAFTRIVKVPLAAGAATALGLGLAGVRSTGALLAFRALRPSPRSPSRRSSGVARAYRRRDGLGWFGAINQTLVRNRRRYGGYVVHLGVVLIVIGSRGRRSRPSATRPLARREHGGRSVQPHLRRPGHQQHA